MNNMNNTLGYEVVQTIYYIDTRIVGEGVTRCYRWIVRCCGCAVQICATVLNWPVDRTCASTGVLGEYRIGYTVHLWAWPEATRGHHVPGGHGQPVSSSAQDCPVISRIQFQPIPFLAWRSTVQVSVIVPTLTANPSDDLSLAATSYLLQLQIGFVF